MTFYTFTLGCKVNSYETAAISNALIEAGFLYDDVNPDVIVINTCSVTHVADQKSRQHIRKFHKNYPHALIVVMGCYAQGNAELILESCGADLVIGTSKRNELVDLILDKLKNRNPSINVNPDSRHFNYEELGVTAYSENIRAYLKIQDGCDNFCTYCIVPYRRGRSRSRDFNTIIEEANNLVNKSYKEIVLTGIHIGKYGHDIGTTFSNLVEELCKIKNLYRIRISSIEESEIDDKLIDLVIHNDKIAKHLHIPLQAGCDKTLKRMGRRYTKAEFLAKINKIKAEIKDICLTTDLIVGFPGESEEDFLESYNFLKEVGFAQVHVFPYSQRTGTPAATYPNQIAPDVKHRRELKVLAYSISSFEEYSSRFVGKEVDVIIEKYDEEKGMYFGHSSSYLNVYIDDPSLKVGDIVKTTYKMY